MIELVFIGHAVTLHVRGDNYREELHSIVLCSKYWHVSLEHTKELHMHMIFVNMFLKFCVVCTYIVVIV